MEKYKLIILLFIIFLFPPALLLAQEVNIIPYLKSIEKGEAQSVSSKIPELKKEYPNDPSILFLDAILTQDGIKAVGKFLTVANKYPKSNYADADLFRVYSYYFSLGKYKSAKDYLSLLSKNYPDSPYLSIANKNIPDKDEIILTDLSHPTPPENSDSQSQKTDLKSNYYIQAAAFTLLENAQKLKTKLDNGGYNTLLKEKEIGGTTFHVIYVEGFSNKEDAEKALKSIDSKFDLSGKVLVQNGE